ncbi:MAG: helix-turn-helix transcriptional regulator [Angelakisella sp.]
MTDSIALKQIMIECGYSKVNKLARDSGVDRNTLALVLNGTLQPSSNVMMKLVATLDINPERAGRIFFARHLRTA